MLAIEDPDLPGLATLSQDRLRAITGADHVALLRLRYRAGKRAILHIAADVGKTRTQGTLWFFKGDKAKRLARRHKTTARFDPKAQALFEAFPNDHRMPQISDFLNRSDKILMGLTGAVAQGDPVLLRYRPGLSCTFLCQSTGGQSTRGQSAGGQAVFVKLINDDCPARLLDANHRMQRHLAGTALRVAPALGFDASVSAIAYGGALGRPLDALLAEAGSLAPLVQAMTALKLFGQSPFLPARRMDPEMLLARAKACAGFMAVTAPGCTAAARAILARLVASRPDAPLRPIHGDMKLEHVFMDKQQTTLIDTESVSLGLPDYDLAQLYGRLWQAELDGQLPRDLVQAASAHIRREAGAGFEWCLDVVALCLAKYYAQRPASDTARNITAILGRLA